ncbi:multidrug resistance efflux pump [Burkholderiales bacterium JOSHI_001]|nr:multidrug resistance efflux pump [Burkholderiales bacterium JOSHI_001]
MTTAPTAHQEATSAPAPADALALLAEVLSAPELAMAAHSLVARLASATGSTRVSLALWQGQALHLLAVSGLDSVDPQSDLSRLTLGALSEAVEQGVALTEPTRDGTDALHIRLELQALQQRVGGAVAVLPLADAAQPGQALGALALERQAGQPFSGAELEWLAHALALAAPALALLQRAEAPAHQRLMRSAQAAWHRLQEPGQHHRRRLWQLGGALLAFLALVPLTHEVGGTARLEGAEQRVLAAPTDGFIKAAPVRPGDRVAAGAVLLELTERDLQLERERWASQLAQHENAFAAAMARNDRTQAAVSSAKVDEAQAQLSLVDEQLLRSRLLAPFAGVVIQGDWSQQIGAPVRQGDTLVTLAASQGYRVMVEVDEIDIARVQPGQTGTLLLSALPWGGHDVLVERITPLAKAVDGRNVFEVQARLTEAGVEADPDLRPGLQGRARLAVGRLPLLWAWARPWLDRARLALWSLGA